MQFQKRAKTHKKNARSVGARGHAPKTSKKKVKKLAKSQPAKGCNQGAIRVAVNAAANRALAPEASKLLELETQVIHIDLGIFKGVFVAVADVDPDGVRLDNGMRLKNQELLRPSQLPGPHPPQPRPPRGPEVPAAPQRLPHRPCLGLQRMLVHSRVCFLYGVPYLQRSRPPRAGAP